MNHADIAALIESKQAEPQTVGTTISTSLNGRF